MEVAVSSELTGQLWNCCVWDPLSGTILRTYKGGISSSKTLNIVGGDYMISAQKDKPLLQVWALNRQDQLTLRMGMPGVVQCLAVSPSSDFCVGAINEQLYVWQVSTGKLAGTLRRHYQNVVKVAFTPDGSFFVSAGGEGLVLFWSLEKVLNQGSSAEPEFTWSSHSLPVTDVFVTQSMVISVSSDQTCKVHDLATGQVLVSIQTSEPLKSVVTDNAEMCLYIGTMSGKILEVDLTNPPRNVDSTVDVRQQNKFKGHEKSITALSVSLDGNLLLSGSDDGTARTWDITSGQCLKVFLHRGPVTNAFFAPKYRHFESEQFKPKTILNNFQRQGDVNVDNAEVIVKERPFRLEACREISGSGNLSTDKELQSLVQVLQKANKELYEFALDKIIPENGHL